MGRARPEGQGSCYFTVSEITHIQPIILTAFIRIVNHILECPKKAGPFKDKAKTQDGLHVFFKYHVLRFPEEKQSADVKLLMVESYMEESQVQNDQPFSVSRPTQSLYSNDSQSYDPLSRLRGWKIWAY
jgi:hypothetical protein